MTDVVSGVPIQFEIAHSRLAGARDVLRGDGGEIRQSLELAAAQMAVGLAASSAGVTEVLLLEDIIEEYRQNVNPDRKADESNFFTVDDVLSEHERTFLPSARVIVGLTYQAARVNTWKRLLDN